MELDVNNLIKPPAKPKPRKRSKQFNWETLPLDEWNSTTFRVYLDHLNLEANGMETLEYILQDTKRNGIVRLTNIGLKRASEKYGKLELKLFLELCVANQKTNKTYPTVNYPFMERFMFQKYMPMAIEQAEKERNKQEEVEQTSNNLKEAEELF